MHVLIGVCFQVLPRCPRNQERDIQKLSQARGGLPTVDKHLLKNPIWNDASLGGINMRTK